jgi:Fe-S oxidoreductase
MKNSPALKNLGVACEQLAHIEKENLLPLPPPYDNIEKQSAWKQITESQRQELETSLDDALALGFPRPKTTAEEQKLVRSFLAGVGKLFTRENNWTFLQPLMLSMESCARCQTCIEACPVYEASGRVEIYRPTFRAEALRRIYYKYIKPGLKFFRKIKYGDIELNWRTIARLMELSYRCTICRRCAQNCPMGVDNGLITHELRKVFSQEMGIAPKEIHDQGSIRQMSIGSSTGMKPLVVKDNMDFIDDDISEKTGIKIKTHWDREGAEVLLIHNAGEILSWPENPGAFAILLQSAGISWTLSSDLIGYDAINYGLWYDDVQFARVALKHAQIAKKLNVKKIVMGECGHAHKALAVIADRIFIADYNIPRESAFTFLEHLVFSGKIKFNPAKNNFPVTLHDPCNMVRSMGIVQPQRHILRYLAPRFREMEPHGVYNYCCGGGSGLAIMSSYNFQDWRLNISGRMKLKQIIETFQNEPQETNKYVCAPCSNCKGQIRDLFEYYNVWEKSHILYGGLVELIVNAMVDIKKPYIEWEWR